MILHYPHVGIVITHGVHLHGQAIGRWEAGNGCCPGCISETIKCRIVMLGGDIGKEL